MKAETSFLEQYVFIVTYFLHSDTVCHNWHTDRLEPEPIQLSTTPALVKVDQPASSQLVTLILPHRLYAFLHTCQQTTVVNSTVVLV